MSVISKLKVPESEKFYHWLAIFFLALQGLIVALTAVNIPAGDEWESLRTNAMPGGFNLEYIFAFHNEHRIVFTKLLNYFFLYTTDWNLKYQVIFNYFIFSSIVLFFIFFQKKFIPDATKGIWILPFFLASPINVDNLNWAIQSCFHFCVLFGLLGIFFATKGRPRMFYFWLSSVLALFSMYSLAAGIFFALMILGILVYHLLMEPNKISIGVLFKLLAVTTLCLGMALWFKGYHHQENHPPYTWPYELDFWYFYANLVSFSFGFKSANFVIAFISLALVVGVLWKSLTKAFTFQHRFISFGFFGALSVLGAYGSIALSRTGFGIGQAKTSRYSELGMLMVPFIGWLLWDLAKQFPKHQKTFKYFIWFVFIGFAGDYSYSTYFSVGQTRTEALSCIAKYYSGENKAGDCPTLYPGSIAEMLDNAKKMSLSWVPK